MNAPDKVPPAVVTATQSSRPATPLSLHAKAIAEALRAKNALLQARASRDEAEDRITAIVGKVARAAAKDDAAFAETLCAKMRTVKLTPRERSEIAHLCSPKL